MACRVAESCCACSMGIGTDCMFAAHDHHIIMCHDLKEFCADPDLWGDLHRANYLLDFLRKSVRSHMADEEAVLIPLLKQMEIIRDDKGECSLIEAEHRRDSYTLNRVAFELECLSNGRQPPNPATLAVAGTAFTLNYLRHIAAEEVELRPLAQMLTRNQHDVLWAGLRENRARLEKEHRLS